MADFPALPLWTDAYLADTRHLSTLEHGAYLLLLMEAWRRPSCSLPDDDNMLSRLAGMDAAAWQNIKSTVMSFWILSRGEWTQKRLKKERSYVTKTSAIQRKRALSGWKTKKSDDARKMPGASRKQAPTPTPTPNKKEPNGSPDLRGNLAAPSEPSVAERAVAMWNDLASKHDLPQAQLLTDRRRASIAERLKDAGGIDGWAHALGLVEQSDFLLGRKGDFRADLDFVLQKKSFVKLMEGSYSGSRNQRRGSAVMDELRGLAHGK